MRESRRRSLISLANAAALSDDSAWDDFLGEVVKTFHVSGAALITPEPDARQRSFSRAVGSCLASVPAFLQHWIGKDEWAISAEERGRFIAAGDCGVGEEVVEEQRLRRSPYFNEFCAPFEITHLLSLKVTDRTDAIAPVTHLSLMRPSAIEPSLKADLKSLWQPLQRSVHAYWLLDRARRIGTASERSLDAIPAPAWIVEADAKIVFANQAACAPSGQALATSSAGRITSIGDLRMADLLKLQPSNARAPIALVQAHAVQRATLHVVAIDETCSFALAWPTARYLLMVEGSAVEDLDKAWLVRVAVRYGLSDRESAVLGQIALGRTPEEVATGLSIAEPTVRTHLSSVLQKTGCRRQADLVRLALRGSQRPS